MVRERPATTRVETRDEVFGKLDARLNTAATEGAERGTPVAVLRRAAVAAALIRSLPWQGDQRPAPDPNEQALRNELITDQRDLSVEAAALRSALLTSRTADYDPGGVIAEWIETGQTPETRGTR